MSEPSKFQEIGAEVTGHIKMLIQGTFHSVKTCLLCSRSEKHVSLPLSSSLRTLRQTNHMAASSTLGTSPVNKQGFHSYVFTQVRVAIPNTRNPVKTTNFVFLNKKLNARLKLVVKLVQMWFVSLWIFWERSYALEPRLCIRN